MLELEKFLGDMGLRDKEARVYLACLKFPNQPTSIIAKKTTLNRGTAFVILHQLLEKGLVKKSISQGMQRFLPVSPDELLIYLEKKEFSLKKQHQRLEKLLPSFRNIQGIASAKPIFQFYEGRDGLQNLFSEMLRGEHKVIKGIVSPAFLINALGNDFMENFIGRRVKKGLKFFLLLAHEDFGEKGFETSKEFLRETRYMPEPMSFPMTTYIYGEMAILFSHKELFGLSIQSHEYKEMQELFFDTTWAISKEKVSESDFRMPMI